MIIVCVLITSLVVGYFLGVYATSKISAKMIKGQLDNGYITMGTNVYKVEKLK